MKKQIKNKNKRIKQRSNAKGKQKICVNRSENKFPEISYFLIGMTTENIIVIYLINISIF